MPDTGVKLEPIADGLWGAQWDLTMGGIMNFRGRMTVIKLHTGGLALHSPIPIDDRLAAELAKLGPVEHLIAPSCLHHVHLAGARERYPDAVLWGPPRLGNKRKDLVFDKVLEADLSAPWSADLDHVYLEGNAWLDEFVFFHRPSKTLIVTDLVFNISEAKGWFTRMILRMVGAYGKVAQSKMVRFTTKDRTRFRASLESLLAWDFERLIMAHGNIIEVEPRAALAGPLAWALSEPPRQLVT